MAPFFLGGIFFYLFSRKKETQRILYEVKLPTYFPLLIFAGFAIITASSYVNSMICQLIGYSMPEELFNQTYDNPYAVIAYMATALAPAFAEEFLFRGVVYGNLRPFGKGQAVLISAALFALMHQNIGQLFYTFVGGIAMALMYELTGSIWCGIFFHLLNNELSVLIEVLYYGKFGEALEPLLMLWDAVVLVLGTVSILILIRYYRKNAREAEKDRESGVFGAQGSTEVAAYDTPADGATVARGLRTPGMIVFGAVAVASMVLTYIMIMFMDIEALL
jgi:membrane protease YdiL (CAAX protease family)